ncbi:MAG: rod shape-determining protein MreD [Rhodocyclaceae bacterium]|nr:rod shape-determining protein MreD [Rhodocyclaceae bacterium]
MSGSQASNASNRILRPVSVAFIVLTLFASMLANLIPFGRFPGIPDWVALTLVFWCIHQPLRVGMGAAFVLGLVMDVADASVMGQHSLAYVVLAFTAATLSRRILWFPLAQQAIHVLPMLLATQLIMVIARMLAGAEFPGLWWFLSSFTATALWHPLTHVLLLPQFQPEDKDVHRPI